MAQSLVLSFVQVNRLEIVRIKDLSLLVVVVQSNQTKSFKRLQEAV
jgi:hypothetical protein